MKQLFFGLLLMLSVSVWAQKPCDFSVNVTDSIGNYKATKDYLLYEKNFAGNASYIFASIVISDGLPMLNVQFIEKSNDFVKARCFDKNSRFYAQLNNGKIVTLMHLDQESCGAMVRDEKGMNNRVLTGYFMFRKEDYLELKKSAVSFIRIKFTTDTTDYILKKTLTSELDGKVYEPEHYFMDYFHCIEDLN